MISVLILTAALAVDDGGADAGEDDATPLACDGNLCDTTNGGLCNTTYGGRGSLVPLAAIALAGLFWRRRRAAAAAMALGSTVIASTAHAETEEAVNVKVPDLPEPHRDVVVALNPLPLLTLQKLSADVVITPGEHHALVVSPFYSWASTAPIAIFNTAGQATNLPEQTFHGFGTELGYRYYFGHGGARGLFVGPSVILGWFEAEAQNNSKTHFFDIGLAGDVGYQMLVGDRVAISLGAGIQGIWTTKDIPDQQWPARIYANRGIGPRALMTIGWAF